MTNKKQIVKIAREIRTADEFSIWSIYRSDDKRIELPESIKLAKGIIRNAQEKESVMSEDLFADTGQNSLRFDMEFEVLNESYDSDTYDDGDIRHNHFVRFWYRGNMYDYYYSL